MVLGLSAFAPTPALPHGEGSQAIECANEALGLISEEQDPALRGRALWTLAEGLAAEGKIDEAIVAFGQAEDLLRGETRYSAEILRARALLLERAGGSTRPCSHSSE